MINIVKVVIFMAKTKEDSIYVIDTVVKITDHRAIGKILQLHFCTVGSIIMRWK